MERLYITELPPINRVSAKQSLTTEAEPSTHDVLEFAEFGD